MKKFTVLLFALIVGAFAMQLSAAPGKAPARSSIYNSDQGFTNALQLVLVHSTASASSAG